MKPTGSIDIAAQSLEMVGSDTRVAQPMSQDVLKSLIDFTNSSSIAAELDSWLGLVGATAAVAS